MTAVQQFRRSESPVARAVALADLIGAEAPAIEAAGRLTDPVVAALRGAGLFRLLLPRVLGGEEAAPVDFLGVVEALAKADASTAWVMSQTSICAMAGALLPLDVAQAMLADPASMIAWGFAPDATAVICDGGYHVSGAWSFGSGAHHARWLGGPCGLRGPDGQPRCDAAGKPVTRMMLFPAAAAAMTETWRVMGLRGTGSDSYAVTNLFVPATYAIRLGDPPLPHASGALYLLSHDSLWASGFACVALGVARAMLAALIAAAREKTPRGFRRTLAETAAVQALVARADVRLEAARGHLFGTFDTIWRETQATRRMEIAQRMRIRAAASHAIDTADEAASAVYRAMGTTAVFAGNPFERRLRDMHMVTQHAHGRHSHYETVGQFMLGLSPDLAFL